MHPAAETNIHPYAQVLRSEGEQNIREAARMERPPPDFQLNPRALLLMTRTAGLLRELSQVRQVLACTLTMTPEDDRTLSGDEAAQTFAVWQGLKNEESALLSLLQNGRWPGGRPVGSQEHIEAGERLATLNPALREAERAYLQAQNAASTGRGAAAGPQGH